MDSKDLLICVHIWILKYHLLFDTYGEYPAVVSVGAASLNIHKY